MCMSCSSSILILINDLNTIPPLKKLSLTPFIAFRILEQNKKNLS